MEQISLSPSVAWILKMRPLITVINIKVSLHSDTGHDTNLPGKKKCEAGLPQLLLLLPPEPFSEAPGSEVTVRLWYKGPGGSLSPSPSFYFLGSAYGDDSK